MRHHSDSDRLARALTRCAARSTSWFGQVYRCSSPLYANKDDLLTGAGSKSVGARWNPPGSFRTIYTSLDPHTAVDEALAHFVHYGLPIAKAMPRVIVSLHARLHQVLDLTDGSVRHVLGISERRMLDEPWRQEQRKGREALTQAIGRLAFDDNWEALLVPSAARVGGVNLVIFPANLDPPRSWVKIINKAELPGRI
jgi:RES domain-containing protein